VGNTVIIPLNRSQRFNFSYLKNASQRLDNYYRVKRNELLPDIETSFNLNEDALRIINNLDATEKVATGQKLLMPISPALFNKHKLYTVKANGEYIFDIAFNHSVTIDSILKANYFKNGNTKLKSGTTIIIPLTEDSITEWVEYENGKPKDSLLG
ncbi:MAG: Peptidoglycan-binding LysM, partial [Candidatus Frackibacter sp. T328-2]